MNSIRAQLTRRLILGTVLLVGGGGAGAYLCMRAALINQFDDALRAKAQAVSAITELSADGDVELDLPGFQLPGFRANSACDYFEIWRADGTVIARSDSLGEAHLPRPNPASGRPSIWNLDLQPGIPGRALSMTFAPRTSDEITRPGPPVILSLVTASTRRELDLTLRAGMLVLGGGVAFLLLMTISLGPRLLNRVLRSLDTLSDQAARITASSLNTRFVTESMPVELQPITHRFNDLLARLETSFERERQFSADLAHELRTPLAELRSQAEFALKWPDCRAPNGNTETLAIALHMESIVTRLLALARTENGQILVRREVVLLAAMVEEVWYPLADKATARQLQAQFQLNKAIQAEADPDMLREILANLLSNAVDYTPIRGDVEIVLTTANGHFALCISNTVQGLNAVDLENMFGRFWRKETARTGTDHAGLGLSLARAFAEALGWKLTAALDGPACLVMTLAGSLGERAVENDGKNSEPKLH